MDIIKIVCFGLLALYVLIINIAGYLSMSIDKKRAIKGEWRISESMLLSISFLGGAIGSMIGMQVKRHKTKHKKFTIGVPICLVVSSVIIGFVAYLIFVI